MRSFISKNSYFFILAAILLFVLAVSLPTLTTRPRLWADEAKSIELALNFERFGMLDMQTAPGELSGIPHLLQSTGYPVTAPLAGIFSLFGFSMTVARTYMLFWMIAALCGIFFFLRRLFGVREAIFAIALIATFASFHDNARTVVGEIPGFLFMIIGLWVLLFHFQYDENHLFFESALAGFFFGLAVVTKPSIYMAILPAITVTLYFRDQDIKRWFWEVCVLAIGAIIPAILWFFLVFGNPLGPLNISAWQEVALFWQNPFDDGSLWSNILYNAQGIIFSSTLLYFGMLFVVLLLAAKHFWHTEEKRIFFVFVVVYSALAFFYYLRSPGWLRYIIAAELLILMSVPYALGAVMKWRHGASLVCSVLITIQIIHFFTVAQIYTSDVALRAGQALNDRYPTKTIAILGEPTIALFIPPERKHQIIEMVGLPVLGKNPLFSDPLPDVVLSAGDGRFLAEAGDIISSFYNHAESIQGYPTFIRMAQ